MDSKKPVEIAKKLADSASLSLEISRAVIQKRSSTNLMNIPSIEIIQAQQKVADYFYGLKLGLI